MARDKENKMIEELRQRIREGAAKRASKPVEQNMPSIMEEAGGRAKLNKPKIMEGLKGSARQNMPSEMRGKPSTTELEARLKKKAAEEKDIQKLRNRAKKAAANKKPSEQVMPSIMKEMAAKTGKPIGASLTVTKESVTVSPATKKKEEPKKAPAKKAETKKEPSFKEAFAAARKAGNKEFTWKGKKYAAVTKTEVDKSGAKSLQEYLNKKAGKAAKGMYATKNRTGAHDYRAGGMLMSVEDRRKMK